MGRDHLGELEELVLLTVLRLGDEAVAIDVRRGMQSLAGRKVSRGALYATLERLREKGWLDWEVGDSGPERGGIPRRVFRPTPDGIDALRAVRRQRLLLWEGMEHVLD